ncbi:MAG: hypothetical protein U0574_06630 [Phycisphaerales bacterium]
MLHRRPRLHALLLASGFLASALPAPAALGADVRVEKGPLVLRFERPARVDGARRAPVRMEAEAFSGRMLTASASAPPGPVKAGDLLLTIAAPDMADQVTDARAAVSEGERRLEVLRAERALAAVQAQTGVERAEVAAVAAERTLRFWKEFDKARAMESFELRVQGQADSLADEKEELTQLEKMYGSTSLAGETKDIVLNRARRSLARNERYMTFARRDLSTYKDFLHAEEERKVVDGARYAAQDLKAARETQRLGAIRAELDLAGAERGLADARERLARLERDQARLRVVAPFDGLWSPTVRDAGDPIQPWSPLGEVVDVSSLRVRGSLPALGLRILASGGTITARFPSEPGRSAALTPAELNRVGTPDGDGSLHAFVAPLAGDAAAGLLPGAECRVGGSLTLDGRLTIPLRAVTTRDGFSTVTKVSGSGRDVVPVVIGASDGTRVEIISGLSEGDVVVAPDA